MNLCPTFQIGFKWKMFTLKTYYNSVLISTTHFVQRKQKLPLFAFTPSCVLKQEIISGIFIRPLYVLSV